MTSFEHLFHLCNSLVSNSYKSIITHHMSMKFSFQKIELSNISSVVLHPKKQQTDIIKPEPKHYNDCQVNHNISLKIVQSVTIKSLLLTHPKSKHLPIATASVFPILPKCTENDVPRTTISSTTNYCGIN